MNRLACNVGSLYSVGKQNNMIVIQTCEQTVTDDLHRFSSSNQQQSLHLLNNVNNKPVSKALQSTQIKPKKLFPRIKIITWYKWRQLAKKFHTLMSTFSARFPTLFHKPGNHMNQCYATQCSKSPEALKQRRISLVCPWFSDVPPQATNNKVCMKVVYQKETKIFHDAILLPCQWASIIPGLLWDTYKVEIKLQPCWKILKHCNLTNIFSWYHQESKCTTNHSCQWRICRFVRFHILCPNATGKCIMQQQIPVIHLGHTRKEKMYYYLVIRPTLVLLYIYSVLL